MRASLLLVTLVLTGCDVLSGSFSKDNRKSCVEDPAACDPGQSCVPSSGLCEETPVPLCKSGGFCWQSPLPQGNAFNGLWGTRTDDLWAVGALGTIVHWNGTAWQQAQSPTQSSLKQIWGVHARDIWAVGDLGTILHWDGNSWAVVMSGTTRPLPGLWGLGASDVWAVV